MKNFFLIDAFALIYRSFFALNKNPRLNSKGLNTSAILGFANAILDIINKYHPDYMAVGFESKTPTFRKTEYEDYKANRPPMPEELRDSIPYIEQFLEVSNIAMVSCEGYEADDVIGTMAKKAKHAGFDVYMVTPDKDYLQLVEDNISVLHLQTGFSPEHILRTKDVLEKFSIKNVSQVIDYLGLCGDSADNIPGVNGIGDKKAKALLNQFDSIEEIISNTDKIESNQVRKAIEDNKSAALFSKKLATIITNVPIDFSKDDYAFKKPNFLEAKRLFDELEFRKFSERYYKTYNTSPFNTNEIKKENNIVVGNIDNPKQPDLFSFANGDATTSNADKPIIIDKHSKYYPLLLMSYLIDPEQRVDNAYLVNNAQTLEKEYSTKLKQQGIYPLYENVELPLCDVLLDMENTGVRFDGNAIAEFSTSLAKRRDALSEEIYTLSGERFNISSPKRLGIVLFEKMNILGEEKAKKTKTHQYSTAEEVLAKLRDRSPIIDKILLLREVTKLKNTYVDALPLLVDKKDGKIHTNFNQTVTATGRLSSANPNLQNIPIRTPLGKEIRKAFVASDDDHILLSSDYSQIELRIIASMSGDEHLCKEFSLGHDIHAATAAKIYGVSLDEVSKEQRSKAKSVNFGIIYGMSAFGLSERLNISRIESAELIKQYFASFPKIRKFIDDRILFAQTNGYAETMLHRRRYLRNILSKNSSLRNFDERNAVNMTIQGTGADMIKIAMVNLYKELKQKNLSSKLILQIHDELILDVKKSELDEVMALTKEVMENALPLKDVPVKVEMGYGNNWLEIH